MPCYARSNLIHLMLTASLKIASFLCAWFNLTLYRHVDYDH